MGDDVGKVMAAIPEYTERVLAWSDAHGGANPFTVERTGITEADRKLLRQPFAASAIRWLPIAGMIGQKQQFMPHINASIVFERLAEVDPSWSCTVEPMLKGVNPADPFAIMQGTPFRCLLTVKGVTRPGLGQLKPGASMDDKHLKSAESDSIKRAALAFEVGAYLRAFETVFLPRTVQGAELFKTKKGKDSRGRDVEKFSYLTDEGKRQLQAHYERVMKQQVFVDRYGEPVEYGDPSVDDELGLNDEGAAVQAEVEAAEPETSSDAQLEALLLLTKYNGRETPEHVVKETLTAHPFVKCLARVLTSVKANLLVDEDDAEKLRVLAVDAGEGSDEAIALLEDALEQLQALAEAKRGESDETQETMPV